jgi:hypothetical protein
MLAMSPLYRWFCHCEDFEQIQVPGKSTLADYATWLPLEDLEEVHEQLRRAISNEEHARIIGVENELDLSVVWLDSTCLKSQHPFSRRLDFAARHGMHDLQVHCHHPASRAQASDRRCGRIPEIHQRAVHGHGRVASQTRRQKANQKRAAEDEADLQNCARTWEALP